MKLGAGKTREAYCLTASTCLVRMRGRLAISVASAHRARDKGEEATHSPKSWETQESRKAVAPLDRISVMLRLRRMSQEKGITRATQGKMMVWSEVDGGAGEGGVSYIPN